MCMCTCLLVYMHVRVPMKAKALYPSGAGVMGGCEPFDVVLGIKHGSSSRAIDTFNSKAISPALF